ncbi:MAG: CotH kinase family protein [Bacteroidaceae bacterium]|nr:CotH kinase family protein [Bacteroidaceae bacterium]
MKPNARPEALALCWIRWMVLAMVMMWGFLPTAHAVLTFNPNVKYRIVCRQYGRGGLALGTIHNTQTALYYITTSDSYEDQFWYFHEVSPGQFTIRNASTGGFITYDGIYSGSYNRYVCITDEVRGDSSLWTVISTGSGNYQIACVMDVDQKYFNVRSSYVVGTFGEAQTDNQQFYFYDENGDLYTPQERNASLSGTTLDGYYWENYGLRQPVVYTVDKSDPIYYYIKNVRSGKYVHFNETGHSLDQSEEQITRFYFIEGSDGVNIYTDAGYYVSGYIGADGPDAIKCLAGETAASDNTWSLEHTTSGNAGYGISVESCEANSADNSYVWKGRTYWNDYYQTGLCYYSLDAGSTFMFYSSDVRHQQLLATQGVFVPDAGTTNGDQDLTSVMDSFFINNKTVVYDKLYKRYMMSVPERFRADKRMPAEIRYVAATRDDYTLQIDGKEVKNGGVYTFKNIGGGNEHVISLLYNGKVQGKGRLTFTFLPIVEIMGNNFSSTYHAGYLRVNDPGTIAPVDSLYHANFRYRGATARSKQKKAYAIKLKDAAGNSIDRTLLGLRNDNNWILDAMAVDGGRMRNRVATDLWNDFSTAPYQKEYEKKAINATRGKFVEVLLNGQYAGLYCMTEKVDRKQLKLKKFKTADGAGQSDTIRGLLYKSSEWTYETFLGHESNQRTYPMKLADSYNNLRDTWESWELKYPDLDDGEPIDWGPLYRAVNVVASENKTNFIAHVGDYFDIPVFMDYYLFIELMLATDNHGKNMYLYNYDATRFNKLGVAPWDLDGVFGRRWDGRTNLVSNAKQDFISFLWAYEHGEYTLFKRLKEYNYRLWNNRLASRYAELRKTHFSHYSLLNRFKDYRNLFKDSGADQREIDRWQGSDDITMNFDNEITYLDQWLTDRLQALDQQYGYVVPDGVERVENSYVGVTGGKGCIVVHLTAPQHLKVYSLQGILLYDKMQAEGVTRLEHFTPGVYVVNNKKVVVR